MRSVYSAKKAKEWFYISEYVFNNIKNNPWKIIFEETFFNELLTALGAGDGNLAFAPGYPDHLTAPGTIEIAVLPVLDPVHQHQKFPVFLIALVGIP